MKKFLSDITNFAREEIFNNSEITGAMTAISFIVSFIGYLLGNVIAKNVFLLLTLFFGLSFLIKKYPKILKILSSFPKLLIFLTWKFFAGVILGIFLGMTLFPIVIPPLIDTALSTVAPEIIVRRMKPPDNRFIDVNSRIDIQFSDPLPWPYSWLLKVDISPKYKIKYDMSLNWLYIYPNQPHAGYGSDRYEFDSHYTVTVSVPGLIDPVKINFCTPKEGVRLEPSSNKKCN